MLTIGHERSGHQVESRDLTSKKKFEFIPNPQFSTECFQTLVLDDVTSTYHLYISDFYIGDLRSGQFLDLSIISQWRNIEIRPIHKIRFRKAEFFQNYVIIGHF